MFTHPDPDPDPRATCPDLDSTHIPAGTSVHHIRVLYNLDHRGRVVLHGVFAGDSIAYQAAQSTHVGASALTFPPGSKDGAALLSLEARIALYAEQRDSYREEQIEILAHYLGITHLQP